MQDEKLARGLARHVVRRINHEWLAKKSPWHIATARVCKPYTIGPVPNPFPLAADARGLVERTGYAACGVARIPHPTRPRALLEALSFAPVVLNEAGPEAGLPS